MGDIPCKKVYMSTSFPLFISYIFFSLCGKFIPNKKGEMLCKKLDTMIKQTLKKLSLEVFYANSLKIDAFNVVFSSGDRHILGLEDREVKKIFYNHYTYA